MTNETVQRLLSRMESYDQEAWTEEQVSDITALCRALLEAWGYKAEAMAARAKIDHDNDVAGEAGDPIPAMLKARKLNGVYASARAANEGSAAKEISCPTGDPWMGDQ